MIVVLHTIKIKALFAEYTPFLVGNMSIKGMNTNRSTPPSGAWLYNNWNELISSHH